MHAFIALAATFLLLPTVAMAGQPLNIRDAVFQALSSDNLIKSAEYRRNAAKSDLSITGSRYLPRLFWEESAQIANTPTRVFMMKLDEGRFSQSDFAMANLNSPSARSDFRTTLTLEQPLFDMSLGHSRELATRGVEARELLVGQSREDAAFRAFTAFLETRKANASMEAAQKGARDAGEHLRLAKLRHETGVGLLADTLRARTFLADAERRQLTAENDLRLARLRLTLALGGPVDAIYAPLPVELAPPTGEMEIIERALSHRADMKGRALERDMEQTRVRQARDAWLPVAGLTASWQMNDRDMLFGRDHDSWQVGAALRWEMFDGMRRGEERKRAEASLAASAELLEQTRKEIAYQVRESLIRAGELDKRMDVAQRNLQDAEETTRLVARRFENSLATMIELLDAQTALDRARAELVESESERTLAIGRIYYAAGTFLEEITK